LGCAIGSASGAFAQTIRYTCLNDSGDKAITACNAILKGNSNDSEAYLSRGSEYGRKGEHDRAISDYNNALALNPQYALAYYNRGLAHESRDDLEQALADFDASIRLRPGNAKAYLWRGEAKFLLGDKAGAAEDYGRSVGIDPNQQSAWYARAKAYERLRRYGEALRDALQAKALGYPVPQAYIDALRKAGGEPAGRRGLLPASP